MIMQILKKLKLVMLVSFTGLLFTSCLKDKGYDNNTYQSVSANSGTEKSEYVSIPKGVTPQILALEAKSGAQDVKLFEVVYDFVNPAASDITVTLTVNNALVTALPLPASGIAYTVLPTAAYTLPSLTLTIPAGQRLSSALLLKMTTNNLPDPTAVYGIGFTMASVSKAGVQIPSNLKNVIYLFSVKNIVHADLKWDFYRWNLATQATTPPTTTRSSGWDGAPTTLATISATANEIASGYFIQPRYRLSWTNNAGVATNFVLTINPSDLADLNAAGVTVVNGPTILIADFATKRYKFWYQVFNGSAYRYIIDEYYK